jgi:NNP family nitrate/nitrite transporter-like MFS transporter
MTQDGQSSSTGEVPPKLLDFSQERIRTLHYTWIAFFMTFYVWFNLAPLATTMLDSIGWLTDEHVKVLLIANVALTIPARIIVGALIDRYGSRVVFTGLMIVMAIPAVAFSFGNTFMQLLIARLVLSSVGAGFVIGIKMVAQWFPPKYIGRAEGFYAGWGNFGSAFAAMTLPWFAITFMGDWLGLGNDAWRWAMAVNGLVMGVYGVMYYFLVRDVPVGEHLHKSKKTEPMMVTSYGDLIMYLVMSFPLVGALMVLAWRVGGVDLNGSPVLSQTVLWAIYGVLFLFYVAHVLKTLQINLPYLRAGVPEDEKYHWGSVAALNTTYFANFGAELAVVSMLPAFYETVFKPLTNDSGMSVVTPTIAGVVAASFAFVNLGARPLGGYISDRMSNRKRTMLTYMIGISIGFLLMGFIGKWTGLVDSDGIKEVVPTFDGIWWLGVAVMFTVIASVFVQGAEGATFAVIPMINHRMTGQIAGMAGAYGNVGAVIYLVLFSLVDSKTFFFILAGGALISFAVTLFMLKEPEGAFEGQFAHDAEGNLEA